MAAASAPVGAGIYHRPSRDWLLVTAVYRRADGKVCGYALRDTYLRRTFADVPVDQVDVLRTEVPGITVIWRDLQPGMSICWDTEPWQLDVVAISDPDDDGWCLIDAVQGSFRTAAADLFTEVAPALADLMVTIVVDESERRR